MGLKNTNSKMCYLKSTNHEHKLEVTERVHLIFPIILLNALEKQDVFNFQGYGTRRAQKEKRGQGRQVGEEERKKKEKEGRRFHQGQVFTKVSVEIFFPLWM